MPTTTASTEAGRLEFPRREMACGAVLGLAWASSMRAMMAEVAASDGGSHFSIATFIFLLPPGTVVGALFAWVLTSPRDGVRSAPRWLVWTPMFLCLDPAATPFMLATVGVGWVAAGRGTRKSRLWIGVPSAVFWTTLLVMVLVVPPTMLSSLKQAWIAILLFSLLGSLMIVETMAVRRLSEPAVAPGPGLAPPDGRDECGDVGGDTVRLFPQDEVPGAVVGDQATARDRGRQISSLLRGKDVLLGTPEDQCRNIDRATQGWWLDGEQPLEDSPPHVLRDRQRRGQLLLEERVRDRAVEW